MGSGGKVANNAGAIITGGLDGVSSGSGTFTLTNAGSITGTAGVAVNINDPASTNKATVTNPPPERSAALRASRSAARASSPIPRRSLAGGTGVLIGGGGSIINNASSTISGSSHGVESTGEPARSPTA